MYTFLEKESDVISLDQDNYYVYVYTKNAYKYKTNDKIYAIETLISKPITCRVVNMTKFSEPAGSSLKEDNNKDPVVLLKYKISGQRIKVRC